VAIAGREPQRHRLAGGQQRALGAELLDAAQVDVELGHQGASPSSPSSVTATTWVALIRKCSSEVHSRTNRPARLRWSTTRGRSAGETAGSGATRRGAAAGRD